MHRFIFCLLQAGTFEDDEALFRGEVIMEHPILRRLHDDFRNSTKQRCLMPGLALHGLQVCCLHVHPDNRLVAHEEMLVARYIFCTAVGPSCQAPANQVLCHMVRAGVNHGNSFDQTVYDSLSILSGNSQMITLSKDVNGQNGHVNGQTACSL